MAGGAQVGMGKKAAAGSEAVDHTIKLLVLGDSGARAAGAGVGFGSHITLGRG